MKKYKILVAVVDYPNNNGGVSLMYVHTRNLFYVKSKLDVTVLNFSCKKDYNYDGISVISLDSYVKSNIEYDILLCHAANIRNHYKFLKKYGDKFEKFIFFYHGHEVLNINKVYSKPYSYVSSSAFRSILQKIYDSYKLHIWHKYLTNVSEKSYFIFVSNWMKNEFLKWTKISPNVIEGRSSITYNSVGEIFEKETYDVSSKKEYDFITIRNNLDGSKYSIDIINRIAFNTPNKKFLVIGKGEFFNHYEKAPNIVWKNVTMNHSQIIDALQKSKFALMPTRTDAQGLMMCEMAAFGIPVITSNLPVCHEVFGSFENVYYIDNDDLKLNLNNFDKKKIKSLKHAVYYKEKTVSHEVEIIKSFINK